MEKVVEPEELRMVFARNLRRCMSARAWSVNQLADRAGVDAKDVGAFVSGDRSPCLDGVAALATALGCDPVELVYPCDGPAGFLHLATKVER